jgi:hypothetical protein
MITPEKMFEMMNFSKAFEAMNQRRIFDPSAQNSLIEGAAEQVFGLLGAYHAQTRMVVDFWMDQSQAALQEGQKLVKEWCGTLATANAEIVSEMGAKAKDAAKMFELPTPPKAAKTT